MSTISYLASLVQQVIGRQNLIESNAKKVDELPHQTTLEPTSKIPVSRAGISEHLTVQQIISSIQNSNYNQLLAVGTITVDGTDIIVPTGVSGQINGLLYGTSAETTIPITLCDAGFNRKDILVLTTSNTVIAISGEETDGAIVLAPPVPTDTVYITEFDVSDSAIGVTTPPIVGTQFKQKNENQKFNPTLGGTTAVITIQPFGQNYYSVVGPVTGIVGFSKALITASPTAEVPYAGKDFYIENKTDHNVTLKNAFSPVDIPFHLGADLIVPTNGIVWMKYNPNTEKMDLFFKSWIEVDLSTKLDKVSTSGVERAYIINADGSQGTKATSEFKDVLEYANLASFPATGETGIIYVALDTNKTYRWSGSAYVQIGGSTQGKYFTYRAWLPLGHTQTTITSVGTKALTLNGTLSTDVIAGTATKFNRIKKLSAISASTAGASAGWRNVDVYAASLELETEWEQSFYFADTSNTNVPDKRVFVGFKETLPAITNVDPSTLSVAFGMACDGADTNYQFMYNFTSNTLAKIDLGISKSGANTDFFHLKISKKANERIINYYVKNIITGVEVSGNVSYLSNANNKSYLEHIHINNNTTAEPVRIGFGEISIKNYY